MFTATKLRRGMISKDKEGECWTLSHGGKSHVSPLFCSPSFVSSNHHLSYFVVSWGSYWLAGKPLLRPRRHSLHEAPFGLRMVCPLWGSWVCSFSLVLSGVKRGPQFIDWGWFVLLCLINCWLAVLWVVSFSLTNRLGACSFPISVDVSSPTIAVGIVCCELMVVRGLFFAMIAGLCFSHVIWLL